MFRRSVEPKVRNRRDSTAQCDKNDEIISKMKDATSKKIFHGDQNPSIALAWTGDDGVMLAVTTYESFVSFPSVIYRSTDGGRTFLNISASVDMEMVRRKNGVLTATADSSRVILIVNNHPLGFSDSSTLYITRDAGMVFLNMTLFSSDYLSIFINKIFDTFLGPV